MAEQNFKNHGRLDPQFHFVLVPMVLFVLVSTIVLWWPRHTFERGVAVVAAFAFLLNTFLTRVYALKAQDRVIRLEERLRLSALGGAHDSLSVRQMVALRFAADDEVVALAERAAREGLTSRQIKEAVRQWRADHDRI